MFKCFCDICEKELKTVETFQDGELELSTLNKGKFSMRLGRNEYDLCESCFNDIKHFVINKHNRMTIKEK